MLTSPFSKGRSLNRQRALKVLTAPRDWLGLQRREANSSMSSLADSRGFKKTTTATATGTSLNGLISRTMVLQVRYKFFVNFSASSAKLQREITKLCVVWRT